MLGMIIPTANTVVTAASGWGPKSLAGMRSTSPPRRARLPVKPYGNRATFWRSYIRRCRHVRKTGATVTLDTSEVVREYGYGPRHREVPETKHSALSGFRGHLSVTPSAHSVDNRMAPRGSGRVRRIPAAQPGTDSPGQASRPGQRQRRGRVAGSAGAGCGGGDVLLGRTRLHRRWLQAVATAAAPGRPRRALRLPAPSALWRGIGGHGVSIGLGVLRVGGGGAACGRRGPVQGGERHD